MNEQLHTQESGKEGLDAELMEIVKAIQERETDLKRLAADEQFAPAVKERLMNDIHAEISALNKQKMETLAEKERKMNAGEGAEAASAQEIYDFPHEGKQRIGPSLTDRLDRRGNG